ncbi:hypothetical protein AAHE18_08G181800 [Arachis hypogaea]
MDEKKSSFALDHDAHPPQPHCALLDPLSPFIPPTHSHLCHRTLVYLCLSILLQSVPPSFCPIISLRVVMVFRAVIVEIALQTVCSCHHPPAAPTRLLLGFSSIFFWQ